MLMERDREILTWIENHKAITIKQADRMFFKNYKSAARRLSQLEEGNLIKSYKTSLKNEKAYYTDKKLSDHDLLIYDFYSHLVNQGATIVKFVKSPRYMKGIIVPDAFIQFIYKGNFYMTLLEVDYTHYTSMSKFQLYEKLYRDGELEQECYGQFPIILVLRPTNNDLRYNSNNFTVIYLDFQLSKIDELLLA